MKRWLCLILFLSCLLTGGKLFAQSIQIGASFNTGTYANGSSITVPVTLSGVFNQNEKFEIYLSDASGNFGPGTKIGEYSGFFTTFVNGVLPTGLANGNAYKIQVRASTNGANVATTAAFSISGSQAVIAKVGTNNLTVLRTDEIFGRCTPNTNGIIFSDLSTAGSATSVLVKNEYTGELQIGTIINPLKKNYFTVTVTAVLNGIIGTRSYSIINTDSFNPFQSTYTSPICTDPSDPNSGGLTFKINIDAGADIYKNFPGTLYEINWSDGTSNTYTLEQIIQLGGILTHKYTISSCNQSVQTNGTTYYNSFGILTKAYNPFCSVGVPTINIARVFEIPTTSILNAPVACKNSNVTFVNQSTQGTYGDQNQPSCTSNNIFYDWYVDGTKVKSNVNVLTNLVYAFTTTGIHQIVLVPIDPNQNNSNLSLPCFPNFATSTICIEEAPVPDFKFDQSGTLSTSIKGCTPLSIATKNLSNTLTGCSTASYEWTLVNTTTNVSGFYANNAIFLSGTNETSLEPKFSITNPGNYALTLRVKNTCSPAGNIISRNITVVGAPSIPTFSYTSAYCDTIPKQIDFNTHVYNANFAPDADLSYNWTVTGGAFEYATSTSSTSKYPSILFKSFGTYTIKVDYTNVNGCGTASRTQTITFNQPLSASLTANGNATDISECTGTSINLAGIITGPVGYTYQWTKSANAGGTLTPGPINLSNPTAIYTPVAADDDKQLTFNLVVTYPSPVPATCVSAITKTIKVTYTATNTALPSSLKKCSGTAVNFTPISTITNSEFIWTVTSAGANITGWADQATYNTSPIADVLLNSGAFPQDVVYHITPRTAGGCPGTPFNLTVTVYPVLSGNAITASQTICRNQVPALLIQSPSQTLGGGSGAYIYLWEQSGDGVNWSTAPGVSNQVNYQPPGLTSSTFYRRTVYSPDLNTCSLISNSIQITVNPLPDISLSTVSEICSTLNSFAIPFSNTANNPTHFDLVAGTTAMPGFVNLSNVAFTTSPIQISIPANVPANTYDFKLLVRNANGCESAVKTFSLVVKAPPTVASAGTDQVQCNNGTFILGGNTPTVGNGLWTIVGTPNGAVINNTTLPGATLTGLQIGKSVTLRWTITNGTCTDSWDEVILTNVVPTPTATVGANQSLCNTITQTVLSGNTPGGAFQGTWTDVTVGGPGGLIFTPNVNTPNATVSGLLPGNVYTVRWTIAGNSPCGDSFKDLVVAVRPVPTVANAGADGQLCDQSTSNKTYSLNANLDVSRSYETGTWTIASQPPGSAATFSDIHIRTAVIQNLIPGTYRLQWTIANDAGCSSAPDEMILQVYAQPVGGNLNSTTTQVCQGIGNGVLNLTAHVGDIQQWEFATNINGPWTAIPNTTISYSFSNLTQTTFYRVKVVSQGLALGCSSSLPVYSNIFTVTVNPTTVGGTTAVAGGNAIVCQGTNTGAINLTTQVGSVVNWEYSINGGVNWIPIAGSANQTTYNFSGLTQTTQFRALVQSGVCSSAYSSATTITVLALTQAAVSNLDVCTANSVQLNGNAVSGTETGTWSQQSGLNTAGFADIHDPKTAVTGLIVGTYKFVWTIDNAVCTPSTAVSTVNNYPALNNQIQAAVSTICSGQTVNINDQTHTGGTGAYTYTWQSSTDNLNWSAPISGQTGQNLSMVLTVSTYFRRTLSSGPCALESNVIAITVQPPVSNNSITQNQEVCVLKPVAALNGSDPAGGDGSYIYVWQQSANGTSWTTIASANQKNYQPPLLSQTTWYRRLVSTALCSGAQQSTSNEIQVVIRPNAKADFSASKTVACAPFNLAGAITVVAHPDLNASYEWFANNVSIGTGSVFPGYTLNTDGEQVSIKLVTISKYGCENDEKTIVFSTIKSVNAVFTADKQQGCGPLSVTFTNASVPLNGPSFAWDFGNGQTSNLANPGAITFQPHPLKRDTIYTVKLRAYTDCQESFQTMNILVRPQPVSIFTPSTTEGCSPLLVNFSNQSKGHPNTYEFNFGDGSPVLSTTSLADVAHTFTVLATTTFTVTLKVSNECGVSSSSYTIKVRPNTITPNLVVNGPDKQGCPPHTLTFYNNTVGANQFTWDFGDGSPLITNAALSMVHTYTTGGTYHVKLSATNGCSVAETSTDILVYPEPVSAFTTTKAVYCKNEAIAFQNIATSGDFLWDFGDGATSTLVNPQHVYITPGTYTVMLTTWVTQADGTKCAKTVSKSLSILNLPLPQFLTNASAFNCAPFSLQIQNNSQYADKYSWYLDGVLVSTDKNPTNIWLNVPEKVFKLKLVAENTAGCAGVASEQTIQMYPRPKANFSVLPAEVIKIPNYTFSFQNTTSGTATSYRWSFGDGSSSTEVNPKHTYAEVGIYRVTLIANNAQACPDTLSRQVEIQTVPGLLFVPNAFEPASLVAELKSFKPKGSGIAAYSIKVFNKLGQLIWESTELDANGSPAAGWDGMMNGQPAPPDTYFWTIDAKFINRTIWKGMKYKNSDRPKTTGSIYLIR